MISTEIFEPDEYCPHRIIYYRDQNDKVIRHVWVNDDNRIIRDYLYENRKDGQYSCVVLFGTDHITPIGIKEFFYDELDRIITNTQYEIIDGNKIQLVKFKFIYDGNDRRCYKTFVYGRAEEPLGYMLNTYDDAGIAPAGNFNMDGERIGKFNLERLF